MDQEIKKDDKKSLSLRGITQIVYICQALSFFLGLTAIVGVVLNYLRREEVKGSWLESHFTWQMRTFWFGLLFGVIGIILAVVFVGVLIVFATYIWIVYRVVKGWLLLNENKPIENSTKLF